MSAFANNRKTWSWGTLLTTAVALLGMLVLAACHGGGYQPSPGEVLRIVAPTTMKVGSVQAASAQAPGTNAGFRWSIQGGAFQGGNAFPATPEVAFTAVQAGTLTLSCAVVNPAGVVIVPIQSVTIKVLDGTSGGGPALQVPDYVTAGAGGYRASLATPAVAGATYTWSIDAGGALTSPAQGTSVTFAAGAGPILNLTCTETLAGASSATTEAVAVVAPPQPPVITPSATAATPGTNLFATVVATPGWTYQWTLAGGVFAGDPNPTTPVVAFTAGPVGTLTLTCAAVNAAGTVSAATPARITVALPASAAQPALQAPAWATAGAGGLTATLTNYNAALTYLWTIAGGTFAGPTQTPGGQTVTFQAGPGPGGILLTCTATGAGGLTSLPGTAGVALAAAPAQPVIQAPAQATVGAPQVAYVQGRPDETYQWTINNGGAFNGPTQTPIGTAVSFTAAVPGDVVLFCTARNSAGATAQPPAFAGVRFLAPAGQPTLAVTNPWAFAGAAGNTANVVGAQPNLTYTWTIQGGILTSPAQGPAITFTAGPGPSLILTCTATTASGTVSAPASLGVAVGVPPLAPVINAAANVPANSQQVAWVQSRPNETYQWTLPAGIVIIGASNGPVLVYNAGPAGNLALACTATVGAQAQAAVPFNQVVGALPGAPVLQTANPWVTAGAQSAAQVAGGAVPGTTYNWTLSGGTFAGGAVTAQTAAVNFTAGPGGANPTVSLACTATDAGGVPSQPGTLAVAIANQPPVPGLAVPAFFTAGAGPVRAEVVAPLADMIYHWQIQGGTFTNLTQAMDGAVVSLDGTVAGQRNLTCTAENRAGTVSNAGGPVLTTGVAPSALPVVNLNRFWTVGTGGLQATAVPPAGATLNWSIQGGGTFVGGATALVNANAAAIDDAVAGFRMVLCQAVDPAGTPSAPVANVVDIVPAPVIVNFADTTGHPLYVGQPAMLTATFNNGTGQVAGVGAVISGQPFLIPAVPNPANYVLTVTNQAGTAAPPQNLVLNVQAATTTVQFNPNQPELPAVYDQPINLAWILNGAPTQLTLNLLGDTTGAWPINVMNQNPTVINNPRRRQTYRLLSQDPLGVDQAQIMVVARGVDLLAGDGVNFTDAFLNGDATLEAAWRSVTGVAADNLGNLWFSEGGDNTLRQLSPAGQATVLAGLRGNPDDGQFAAAQGRFFNPAGVSWLPDGRVLVADTGTHTLKAVAPNGAVAIYAGVPFNAGNVDSAPGVQGLLDAPVGLATHAASGISFVTEPGTNELRMISPAGEIRTVPSPANLPGGAGMVPVGVAVDPTGNVYVSDIHNNVILQFTPTLPLTMASAWVNHPVAGGFNVPRGLALGTEPDGVTHFLLVADTAAHDLSKIALPGGVVTYFAGGGGAGPGGSGFADGLGIAAAFDSPSALAIAADGSAYVADQNQTALRRILPNATVSTLGRGNTGVASAGTPDGAGAAARFHAPSGLAVDANGNTFVADTLNHTIRMITPEGVVATIAGTAGVAGFRNAPPSQFTFPSKVALDAIGNLYVLESLNDRIRRIDPAGTITNFVVAGLNQPTALAVNAAGHVFVADNGTQTVLEFDPAGALIPTPNLIGLDVTDLAAGPGGLLYALDSDARSIWVLTPPAAAGGAWNVQFLVPPSSLGARDGVVGIVPEPEFNEPGSLAVDAQGNVYVADLSNGLIRKIEPANAAGVTVTTVAGTYPVLGPPALAPVPGVLPAFLPEPKALAVTPAGDLVVAADNAVYLITAP